ncbi:hypothetical protein [Streptomyces sp. Isolate_45]|uniref:hypothetical protein n=1 Tax=Streptomyces sp. Isolate_45 TaxID=2950111 RepID=UPI002481BF19|nr:hypothetical protein [Streptomyces sp. Isolate_45]MDA5284121.1 hypothetical protein [Streptomyces sp. Isolate_45]
MSPRTTAAPHHRSGRPVRVSLVLASAGVLVVGLATSATAQDPIYNPPRLVSLQLQAPNVTVIFRDNSEPDTAFFIELTERDNPTYARIDKTLPGTNAPGVGRTVTRSVNAGIKPGIAYCATVKALVHAEDPVLYDLEDAVTEPSNKVCANPTDAANPAGSPSNASLGTITGEAEPAAGTNRNFWLPYGNAGAEVKGAVIEVSTSGALSIRRPPENGTFSGFQCVQSGAVAGSTSGGFRCTGGTLKAGEKNQIPVLVKVGTAGQGAIHASIRAPGDTNPGDNNSTHTVRVK